MWKKFTSFCQVLKDMHNKEKWFFFLPDGVYAAAAELWRHAEAMAIQPACIVLPDTPLHIFAQLFSCRLRYFNMRSKADMSRLNLPHGNDN